MKKANHKPWYKHAWVWFIIALPSSAVCASIITVIIAFHQSPTMIDGYKKISRHVIVEDQATPGK